MSDFLTNLVIRSFSPVASVQPMGASPYVAPQFQAPFGEFSDPFAEASSSDEQDSGEAREITRPRQASRTRTPQLEAHTEEPSSGKDQASFAAPVADSRSNTIIPLRPEVPDPVESKALRSQPHPLRSDKSPAKQKEAARRPSSSELPIADTTLTSAEGPSAPATHKASVKGKPLVKPELRPVQTKRSEGRAALPSEVAPLDESVAKENVNRPTPTAGKTNETSYDEPLDAGVSTWHLMKRPGKAGQLSPQTSPVHPTRPIVAPAHKLQAAVVESVAERTTAPLEERQEIKTSLTTLIPKVSMQPLLPVNVRTRPNLESRHSRDENGAQPSLNETIINVAIGRIEVRATPAESSKREHQAKGPKVMNLDDYMQQRSRGTR
jgi:hypothetical protein